MLVEAGGAWDLVGPLPTTAALDELVAEHLAGVDARGAGGARAARRVRALRPRRPRAGATAPATLETLEASGLIAVVTSGRRTAVRLAHPLYGEVLRAGLPPLRLRRVQARAGRHRRGPRRPPPRGRPAGRPLAGGVGRPGAGRAPAAARRAWRSPPATRPSPSELVERGRGCRPARRSIGPRCSSRRTRCRADGGRGRAGRRRRSGTSDSSDSRRAHLAKRLADTRFFRDRDLDGALAAHEAARDRLTDPDAIAAVDARRATLLAGAGRPVEALRIAGRWAR